MKEVYEIELPTYFIKQLPVKISGMKKEDCKKSLSY